MSNADAGEAARGRLVRGIASNYLGKALSLGAGVALAPLLLKGLGETWFGLWALIGTVWAYSVVMDLGVGGAVVNAVARQRARGETGEIGALVATATRWCAALGTLVAVLGAGAAVVAPRLIRLPTEHGHNAVVAMLIAGCGAGASLVARVPAATLEGAERFDLANLIRTGIALAGAAATAAVLLTGLGIEGVAVVAAVVPVIGYVAGRRCVAQALPGVRAGWRGANWRYLGSLLPYGLSLFTHHLAWIVRVETNTLVIGLLLPLAMVAPYAIARRLSGVAQALTEQFLVVLIPVASTMHARAESERLRALYITGTRLTLVLALPCAAILTMLARPIMIIWVGPEFGAYAPVVGILTLASVLDTSQWLAGDILQVMGRYRLLLITSWGAAMAAVAGAIVLTRAYGLTGAAISALATAVLLNVIVIAPYAAWYVGASAGNMVHNVLLPALLPMIPTVLTIAALQRLFPMPSILAMAATAVLGGGAYAIGYLCIGATDSERRAMEKFFHHIHSHVFRRG